MASRKKQKMPNIKPINSFVILAIISVFQFITSLCSAMAGESFEIKAIMASGVVIIVEWVYLLFHYIAVHRRNFELELIAFFLTGVGISAIGSIDPGAAFKQSLLVAVGVIGFSIMVFVLGNVDLCMKLRIPVAVAALCLLGVNIVLGKNLNGASNWIEIMGIQIQPSEFVKIAFIFVGSATLEKIQTSKNIIAFIGFAAACVGALIIIRDFGTAMVFFVTFLIIAFMISGDIKTIFLAIASAVFGAGIVVKYKPYVTSRFSVYRNIWSVENYNAGGFQQTRVLVGMASGGLLGLGIGNGRVKNIAYASSDLIFGVICEEWGFIFAMVLVLSFVAIAVSALVNSIAARSTFYSIGAVAAAGMLLFQTSLNIFGVTDILPLTGVTLPFISQGGSSIICCWAVLAYIKASDIRTYSYLNSTKKKGGAKK